MDVKCTTCGSKDVDLRILPFETKDGMRVFCSEDCKLILEYRTYYAVGWVFLILSFPLIPLWLYFFAKAARGKNLKKQREVLKLEEKNLCYQCGKEVELKSIEKVVCMHCGELIHFCDLCQNHILYNDETLQIEPCGHLFHRDELLEWSEKNNVCPKCGVKIEFVDYQPE